MLMARKVALTRIPHQYAISPRMKAILESGDFDTQLTRSRRDMTFAFLAAFLGKD
jgi:hypothetical protein